MKTKECISNTEELLNSELEEVQGETCVCERGGAGQVVIRPVGR